MWLGLGLWNTTARSARLGRVLRRRRWQRQRLRLLSARRRQFTGQVSWPGGRTTPRRQLLQHKVLCQISQLLLVLSLGCCKLFLHIVQLACKLLVVGQHLL